MTKGSDTSFFKLVLSSPYNHNILNIRAGFFRQVELKGGGGGFRHIGLKTAWYR